MAASGFKAFTVLWSGQFVSMLGSSLSGFALGVYVYQLTGSATQLGLIFALGLLPAILTLPFAGPLVDRWGPRRALFVADIGDIIVTSVLAALLASGTFEASYVYFVVPAFSVLGSLSGPAFSTLTPLLVPERHIGRANGLRMLAQALSELLGPIAAGFLLGVIGLKGLVLMDLISFSAALFTLLLIQIPSVPREPEETSAGGVRALLTEFRDGWRYVAARRGLLALLLYLGALSFSAGYIDLLFRPLVLSFASAGALGTVMSCGGLGMIVAGGAMLAWGGPRRGVRAILCLSVVLAAATVVGAARPNLAAVAAAAFAFMAAFALILGINQGIWQTKVEPRMLGRAMAVQSIVASVPQITAYATSGLLADRVFGPLVGRHEVKSSALAALLGHGAGRGTALLIMTLGLLIAVSAGVAALSPRLRRLEDELPDAIREEQDGAVDATAADRAAVAQA